MRVLAVIALMAAVAATSGACSTRPAPGGSDGGDLGRDRPGPTVDRALDTPAGADMEGALDSTDLDAFPDRAPPPPAPGCSDTCTTGAAGALCAPDRCGQGAICVCGDDGWHCPDCPPDLCPEAQPQDGGPCSPTDAPSSCQYPPAPATSGTLCQCQGFSAGPTHWSCQPFDTGCSSTPPPPHESPCPGDFNDCRYVGQGWQLGCVCVGPPFNAWYCYLNSDQPPMAGAPCTAIPGGYQAITQVAPNQYQACSCGLGAWQCKSRLCPDAQPSSNQSCDGYQGLNCTYPGLAGSCVCEDVSNLWQCG
jgi:hypothetical protein